MWLKWGGGGGGGKGSKNNKCKFDLSFISRALVRPRLNRKPPLDVSNTIL